MVDYNVRFERLTHKYRLVIAGECEKLRGKSSADELHATAFIGLFYADIFYVNTVLPFETFARNTMRKALNYYISKNRQSHRGISLNRTVGKFDKKSEALDLLKAPQIDWDIKILMSDFISKQDVLSQCIAKELSGGATIEDIMMEYDLSLTKILEVLAKLRHNLIEQYGEEVALWQ